MNTRRVLRLNSALQLALVLVIVGLANLLGMKHFARLDLTRDRVHTLSQAGRAIMVGLEKPLTVKVFFTKGLEAPYNNHEQIVVDKLDELRAWSRGRMELTVIDPTGNPEAEDEARRLGVAPVQYSFKSNNRQELRQVFMGAAFLYGERQTVLPAITQVETIEYDLARTIKSLIEGDRKTLGFVVGHEEPDLLTARGPLEQLRDDLRERYELVAVDLSDAEGIPEAVDALWVIGPQGEVGQREQYALDQFIMAGKPVAFFLTNYKPDLRTMRTIPVRHGLEPMLGAYGVELNRDLVADRESNGKMRFPVRQGRAIVQVPINYPLIPMATDLAEGSPLVKDLDAMQFPFVSSIDLPEPPPDGVTYEVLARSTSESGRIKNVLRVDPMSYQRRDPSEEVGPWNLLVVARGSFNSFFAGRALPESVTPEEAAGRVNESAPTRIIAAGSADFIANNLAFMLNLADWMVQDEDLISIRAKLVSVPSLRPIDTRERRVYKAVNLLAPSALLLIFGGLRLLRRRAA